MISDIIGKKKKFCLSRVETAKKKKKNVLVFKGSKWVFKVMSTLKCLIPTWEIC